MSLRTTTLAASLLMALSAAHAQTHPLNDTGITWSGHATEGSVTVCDVAYSAGEDCRYGRDAAAASDASTLTKVGDSALTDGVANGFDYTKISNSGSPLPAGAVLGSGPDEWACTRDNVTGLIWEVKTILGVRNQHDTYSWYDSDSPGGDVGTANGGSCATVGRCDTEKYVEDVNAASLCGATDWRMPTVKELEGIVDYGRVNPAIDPDYFPNTLPVVVWSGSPLAALANGAWAVSFESGFGYVDTRNVAFRVRLVRAGQ